MSTCAIVMYHYVRDTEGSRFPGINARTVEEFEAQLDYLEAEYTIIGYDPFRRALRGEAKLPKSAAMLTFDDGFRNHFEVVFQILRRRGLPACFFPPATAIQKKELLDVHKLHALIAVCEDPSQLADSVLELLERFGQQFDLDSSRSYYRRLAREGRWDPPEIIFVKRLLQRELPEKVRARLIAELFDAYVDIDEQTLSKEWYMTPEQLQILLDNNMYVGSHGANHYWLDTLDRDQLVVEIRSSLSFLSDIGATTDNWMIAYPYGAHEPKTLEVVQEFGGIAGLTTESRVADFDVDGPLTLPRLDTNDIP